MYENSSTLTPSTFVLPPLPPLKCCVMDRCTLGFSAMLRTFIPEIRWDFLMIFFDDLLMIFLSFLSVKKIQFSRRKSLKKWSTNHQKKWHKMIKKSDTKMIKKSDKKWSKKHLTPVKGALKRRLLIFGMIEEMLLTRKIVLSEEIIKIISTVNCNCCFQMRRRRCNCCYWLKSSDVYRT